MSYFVVHYPPTHQKNTITDINKGCYLLYIFCQIILKQYIYSIFVFGGGRMFRKLLGEYRFGKTWYDMIWFDLMWYYMIWYNYDMNYCILVVYRFTTSLLTHFTTPPLNSFIPKDYSSDVVRVIDEVSCVGHLRKLFNLWWDDIRLDWIIGGVWSAMLTHLLLHY